MYIYRHTYVLCFQFLQSRSDISKLIKFAAKNLYSEGYKAKFVLLYRPVKFPSHSHGPWRATSKKYCQVERKLKKSLRTLDKQEKQRFIE